jgi:hypothetical protein
MDINMRRCKFCLLEGSGDIFASAGNGTYKNICKKCNNKNKRDKYNSNLELSRKLGKEKAKEFRRTRKEWTRNYDLKRFYNITIEQFEEMKSSQNGKCAICKTTEPKGRHNVFAVDHCHKTGKVRGLLCNKCNVGLGSFRDDIESLNCAVEYLNKNS